MTRQNTTRAQGRPQASRTGGRVWLLLLIVFLALGYWVFARYLERIDLTGEPLGRLWQVLIQFPLPDGFARVREMVAWKVLRHFIPVVAGGWMAYEAAASLVQALYAIPERASAKRFLGQLVRGKAAGKPLPVMPDTLESMRNSHMLLRIGGPGLILINRGYVGVTELNGRFQRTLPSGVHNLRRLEYLHKVLDLKPQERTEQSVFVSTREGIGLWLDVHVRFQVNNGNQPPTRERPFPYDAGAVRQAAYAEIVQADGGLVDWTELPMETAVRILRRIVAGYQLDEILANNQAADPLRAIQSQLVRDVRAALRQRGIQLLGIHLSRLELHQDVSNQYIDFWKSQSDAVIRLSEADGAANALEEMKMVRAEAEVTMIQAILEGVQQARLSANVASMREVVALRMVEALEQMAKRSQQSSAMSPQLMAQLMDLRRQLNSGQVRDEAEEHEGS